MLIKKDNLKDSVEHEIIEIDKEYERVDKETTKSYETKREKLNKEEKDLKDKLKTEVTKIKEKLEIYMSEINNLLKINEKIEKGLKSLEKDEKTMIKTLSYISKINKNQKEMRTLIQESMKNLKISFIEEESTIKYESYYFNGIPIPEEIEFKDVDTNSFKVCWKLDDAYILNCYKEEIKYRMEMRKENSKDEFFQIYEGADNSYIVNKQIEKNTSYEIRICSIYNDLMSNWSNIYKIKTNSFEGIILNEIQKEGYLKKIFEWTGFKKMALIYRGTKDGSDANSFHNKCNNQGPTICLCKNEKGSIFGGYSSISWTVIIIIMLQMIIFYLL